MMNYEVQGIYSPRRRDPKVARRRKAIDRFMAIYRDETSFRTRLAYKFSHPLLDSERDTLLTRYLDTIKRWWLWQTEPGATTVIGKVRRFLVAESRDAQVVRRPSLRCDARFELRAGLRKAFKKAGITNLNAACPERD